MSMKLENLIERCDCMKPAERRSTFRKKRITIVQAIYMLYIVEAINLIATLVLWLRVFFLHSGGN